MDDSNSIKLTKKCPFCGEDIKSTAIKCKHCKKWLNDKKENQDTQKIINLETKTKLCPFCGEKISVAAKKCRYCKNWVIELEDRVEKQKELPKTKTCPYCLEEIPYKAQKCSHCLSDVEILTPSSSKNMRNNLDQYQEHKVGTCFKCGYSGLLGVVQEVKPFKMGCFLITLGIIITLLTFGAGIAILIIGFIVQEYKKKFHCVCPNCGNSIIVGRN
jgi:predicted RNA-binding Zn-ribbon protein involved in translation (DUF1610 family)